MYEICFIDDTIPVISVECINDTERLNKSNLRLLLKEEITWPESEVRALVDALLAEEETWSVSAFTHPDIYLSSVEKDAYRPDIIIYDWEYAGGTGDSSTKLLEILVTTFAVVYIYSGADHETQIEQALNQPEFAYFKDRRLFKLMKNEPDSQKKLLNEAKDFYNNNFSFRFGNCLRVATDKALEQVLVNLGSHDIDFVTYLLSEEETKETDIKTFIIEKVHHYLIQDESLREMIRTKDKYEDNAINELIEFLISKVTEVVNAIELDSKPSASSQTKCENYDVPKSLWSQRIYYYPSDFVVRRGDIINEKGTNRYYLVITGNCDLNRFWNKNFGFINLIPLYSCTQNAREIKSKLKITRSDEQITKLINNMKIKSMTGNIDDLAEGPFICPFLSLDGVNQEFIGFPKEILSIHIDPPKLAEGKHPGELKNKHLTYNLWDKYKRIATISEPFLTALIQRCISVLSGTGTPDYPDVIMNAIRESVKISLSIEGKK